MCLYDSFVVMVKGIIIIKFVRESEASVYVIKIHSPLTNLNIKFKFASSVRNVVVI